MARGFKTGGRQAGTPNRTTALLKEAIIAAAETEGDKGIGGLQGYCQFLARDEPKAFAQLLGKVLPLQIGAEGGTECEINVTIGGDDPARSGAAHDVETEHSTH